MINKLEIVKLFGRFDYNIALQETPITILTGPNGFGKSTILKIVKAISSSDILFFSKITFKKIKAVFSDKTEFIVEQRISDNSITELYVNNHKLPIDILEKHNISIPWIHQIGPDKWMDYRSRTRMNSDSLLSYVYSSENDMFKYLNLNSKSAKACQIAIEEIHTAAKKCGNVRLISEQRLIRKEYDDEHEEQIIDVITELPKKMKDRISELSANYSKSANSLDSTYPQRLLSTESGLSGEVEFGEKMAEANAKFKKLSKYDLVDLQLVKAENYQDEFAKALKIYFEDFEKKYGVFSEFIDKLDLFTEIVNSRLMFKEIKVTRDEGLVIVDQSQPDRTLRLNQLSSGEKQEIVLFYDLIFETDKQLVLMIDEPEISLHILWQKNFIEDLERVVKLGNLKVVIATHSPQIINDRWDIQVDLGELYEC